MLKHSTLKYQSSYAEILIIGILLLCTYISKGQGEKKLLEQGPTEVTTAQAEVFKIVEEHPEYEGGMSAFYNMIQKEIRYPVEARKAKQEGQVDIQFVIDKDGSIADPQVVNGIGAGCDEEVLRVIQMAAPFKPGKQRGKAVRVKMQLPIVFSFDKSQSNEDGRPKGIIVVNEMTTVKDQLKVDAKYADGHWMGTVYGSEGDQLPGVNIIVSGTTHGTVSDLDGSFKLKADPAKAIHVSFVGYETKRIVNE